GLLAGESEDHRVQAQDAELLAAHVEVVALDLFGRLLEGDDRLDRRHLAERARSLVESVTAAHHDAVADGRALRAIQAHAGRRLRQELDEDVDAVDLAGRQRAHYRWMIAQPRRATRHVVVIGAPAR